MHTKIYLIIGGAAVLILAGAVVFSNSRSSGIDQPTPIVADDGVVEIPVTLVAGENSIYAPSQQRGVAVKVGYALLSVNGFVTIHQDDNGVPLTVIGVSPLLEPGNHENLNIVLNRPSKAGETLYAILRVDDGDGKFDADDDVIIGTSGGKAILLSQFTIQ